MKRLNCFVLILLCSLAFCAHAAVDPSLVDENGFVKSTAYTEEQLAKMRQEKVRSDLESMGVIGRASYRGIYKIAGDKDKVAYYTLPDDKSGRLDYLALLACAIFFVGLPVGIPILVIVFLIRFLKRLFGKTNKAA